jgi:BirA family biotin operon repressor/biotin-[acetyl-CoA-carboxylase] ligase
MESVLKTPDLFPWSFPPFVRHVEVHDTLASTNDRAAELARDADVELPTLVVARLQTAGRGRGQNGWWSADGALTFSLLTDAATAGVLPVKWPQLSLATAVAVCDALSSEVGNRRIGIKWPNDVLIDGRKVCGILIESPGGAAPAKDRLIIGVGINVNNSWRLAPHEAGRGGVALCDITSMQHDLSIVLTNLVAAFAARIAQLRVQNAELFRAWRALDVLRGQRVLIETDGRRIERKCLEIAHDGALVIDTQSGRQRLYSGSVRLVS